MHQQIRLIPAKSPPDLEGVLTVLAAAGMKILTVGGSDLEHGGEFGFAVGDELHEAAITLLTTNGYRPRTADVDFEALDPNDPGALLALISRVEQKNRGRGHGVKDIAVGPPDENGMIPVQVYSARKG